MRAAHLAAVVAALVVIVQVHGAAGWAAEGPSANEPYPVVLEPGQVFSVCTSGEILCPATSPICDDLDVAEPVETSEGLGFLGVESGTTLCSAASANGIRRVFRITVRPRSVDGR